jgi:polar amino acid transport system substrate-binding protein
MIRCVARRLASTFTLLALLFLAPMAACADTLVTLLLDEAYPPYSYRTGDEAAGIYADILRAAEPQLRGYRLKLEPQPWRRALAEVEAGRALAIVPPYHRPRERPWIAPYSVPILEERVVVFCHHQVFAKGPRKRWPDDYQGLRFGNNPGYLSADQPFWHAVRRGLILIEEAPGNRANLQKLLRQRIDCYFNERLAILAELALMRRDGLYDPNDATPLVEGPTISVEHGHVGYSNTDNARFPFKADFVRQLNAAIERLRKSGEIERIVHRYTH